MRQAANTFHQRFGKPNTPLGIGGTRVRLGKLPQLPDGFVTQDFWSREQLYSLNFTIMGDSVQVIPDIDPDWPGSTHDSRVLRNFSAKETIER